MNIAIDITPLRNEHKARGVGSYTKLLVEALQKYEEKHSYSFFTRGKNIPKNADMVHYPYFDPFFLTLPLIKVKPTVVTAHDFIPLAFPDKFPRGIKGDMKWQLQKFSLRGAKALITDSKASKKDIREITRIEARRIHVIPLAPAPQYYPIRDVVTLSRVKARYNLPKRFGLYVGDVNWNKNIPGLLTAFGYVTSETSKGKDFNLILAGKAFLDESLSEAQHINRTIEQLRLLHSVKKLGFVPDEDLPALYTLASFYVQPSFAEGFGLPILEAMACGCPVVASNKSSLTEIAGPAIQVDPETPESIARGIMAAIAQDRHTWEAQARDWAAQFSWKRVAQETVGVYRKVASA